MKIHNLNSIDWWSPIIQIWFNDGPQYTILTVWIWLCHRIPIQLISQRARWLGFWVSLVMKFAQINIFLLETFNTLNRLLSRPSSVCYCVARTATLPMWLSLDYTWHPKWPLFIWILRCPEWDGWKTGMSLTGYYTIQSSSAQLPPGRWEESLCHSSAWGHPIPAHEQASCAQYPQLDLPICVSSVLLDIPDDILVSCHITTSIKLKVADILIKLLLCINLHSMNYRLTNNMPFVIMISKRCLAWRQSHHTSVPGM